MVELTEKLLSSAAGWQVMPEARRLHGAGRVSGASYDPPVLKGLVRDGARTFAAGLRITSSTDVENLCSCRIARAEGRICAHSVAVGLAALRPARTPAAPEPARVRPDAGARKEEAGDLPPGVALDLEGTLNGIEAEVRTDDAAARARAVARLEACGFEHKRGRLALDGQPRVLAFLADELPALEDAWSVTSGERLRSFRHGLRRIEPRFVLEPAGDGGWFSFGCRFEADGGEELPLEALRRILATGRSAVPLAGGRMGLVSRRLVEDLEATLRDIRPEARGPQLWNVPEGQAEFLRRGIAAWQNRPAPPPAVEPIPLGCLDDVLRDYQKHGVFWLAARARGGGAILADDMGLGKTAQMLALLRHLGGPALVVCPASLVFNWRAEAERFWPGCRVLLVTGPRRRELGDRIAGADLVLTHYALLRLDATWLRRHAFRAAVLDEAQHIKNPDALNARAALALRAGARFALTGTPVENSLRDLWSLCEFVRPGYLGRAEDFKKDYREPIEKQGDEGARARLRRRLEPLLLRRTKAEVLAELPPRIEQVAYCELTPGQASLYAQMLRAGWRDIESLGRNAAGRRRLAMLTLLLRLRQVCCDTRLLPGAPPTAPEPSAKMDLLREFLEEAADAGRRTLVFSQFASLLALARGDIEEWGMTSCLLTGRTMDREAEVRRFKTDASIPVFLISLKAGGAGLNLAEADHVIHLDPWWNPAAEAQASDRAHRLGQTQTVLVRKLIARDTVEERVLRLQESKKSLTAGFFENDDDAARAGAGLDLEEIEHLLRG